jgi:hypothetical protein
VDQVIGKRGEIVRVDAGDICADIGKQTPAHGGGQALADFDYTEARQQRHRRPRSHDIRLGLLIPIITTRNPVMTAIATQKDREGRVTH